jgi:hypothetical protein
VKRLVLLPHKVLRRLNETSLGSVSCPKERTMKFGSCLFAVLAFAALSMNSAIAGHRGHGSRSAASYHHHFRVGSPAGTDSGSEIKGAVADHAKDDAAKDRGRLIGVDKGSGEDEHRHAPKSERAGVSTPAHSASGKEHAADDAIDTRIPMHQGRETTKNLKMRHFKSSNVDVAARNGFKHEHISTRRGEASVRSSGVPRRNAVGATVDSDKAGERRNALGVAIVPKGTVSGLETKSDSVPLATGAVTHDSGAEHPNGKVPADGSFSGATPGNRRDGAPTVAVATTNGLSISGPGMIRPGSNTAAIGGAPKIAVGVLSGNSFRPKHP